MPSPRFTFQYDPAKARRNLKKHSVSFDEALTVFYDPLAATLPDESHSGNESRFITIGLSARRRVLFVVHTEEPKGIRLISARLATATERRHYEED
jgi:hypothetical protein